MNSKNLFFYSFLLLSIFAGCNGSTEEGSSDAFFRGHIVNPTSEYIVLSKDSITVDTTYLDENDNFIFFLPDTKEGLYNFKHGYESQVIYLVPGDSLLMWLNTLEFDETIHFSGKGGSENNYLIDLFLKNEKNSNLVLDYYKIKPTEFGTIIDSIKQVRLERLDHIVVEKGLSEDFAGVAQKMIQYDNYNLKEKYAYLVNKYRPEFALNYPDDFFAYRENLNFSEKSFQTNPTYLRFLDNYLINLSMMDCKGNPLNNPCYDQNNIANITKRIHLIDSLTNLPAIRNYFLNRLGTTGMIMGKNREELVAILQTLKENNMSENNLNNLIALGSIQLAFIPGINLGEIPLINAAGEKLDAHEILDGRTIFYIWSINSPTHHRNQHQKIEELKIKYPEIDFLGINIDIGELSAWENALRKYRYDLGSEFQLDEIMIRENKIEPEIFQSYLNKLLFLDASGTVVIGDAYLDSPDFESRILEFLNL